MEDKRIYVEIKLFGKENFCGWEKQALWASLTIEENC